VLMGDESLWGVLCVCCDDGVGVGGGGGGGGDNGQHSCTCCNTLQHSTVNRGCTWFEEDGKPEIDSL
jgi:hypothetical protein